MSVLAGWPPWVSHLVWTVTIVGVSYLAGHLASVIVGARLTRLAARTPGDWDDALVAEVTRRIPFWSLLVGAWLSLSHWPLSDESHQLATRVLSALGVGSATFAVAAVATRLVAAYGPRTAPAAPVSALSQNIVRILVTVLGLLVVVKSFGYDITPYLTALGVGGLAVALALQDPLSNLFAGVFMTVSGQIRIGDYVKLDSGAEGYLVDFNWRATSIRMLSNNVVIVPNAKLAQSTVINFHQPSHELVVAVEIGVDYASDLAKVEQATIEVAKDVMIQVVGGVPDFQPVVRFHTFGPSSINGSVTMRGREIADQSLVKHEFVKRLQLRYAQEGIVMPFPTTTLSLREPVPVDVVRSQA